MIKVMKRPLVLDKQTKTRLDTEFSSVRWVNHRLIDFENDHQKILDEVQEKVAPGLTRIGTLIAKLEGRKKRAERSTKQERSHHPELLKALRAKIPELKNVRNASEEWKAALKWDTDKISQEEFEQLSAKYDGFSEHWFRRQAGETDAELAERAEKAGAIFVEKQNRSGYCTMPTRREAYLKSVYRERSCYYNSFTAVVDAVKQSKATVLKERKAGKSASIRRPSVRDSYRIHYQVGKKRSIDDNTTQLYIEKERLWWKATLPVGLNESINVKFKGGNWHKIPEDASVLEIQLIRREVANSYKYHVCITFDGSFEQKEFATTGEVGLDWGHRQMQGSIRAFYYNGSDNKSGEINLCVRDLMDLKMKLISNLDNTFNAKKVNFSTTSKSGAIIPITSRYQYRRHLKSLGVRTEEESKWLRFETKQEQRIDKLNRRIDNLRNETYTKEIRNLRMHYYTVAVEDITGNQFKEKYTKDMELHRKRQNRDVVARYKFMTLLERYGANIIKVDPKNTTKTCPHCNHINEFKNTDIDVSCTSCGKVGDRDEWAAINIRRRGHEKLMSQG